MNERVARWTLGLGAVLSLSAALVVMLDMHRRADALAHADGIDPRVADGRRAWRRHDCSDCHTLLGYGTQYGPDLTKVYGRRGEDGIRRAVRTPEQVTTWRSMPHLPVTDRELAGLVAFLQWTSGTSPEDWPVAGIRQRVSAREAGRPRADGSAIFRENRCYACHRMGGSGGALGPDLTHVGGRLAYQTIEAVLADPRSVDPRAVMPAPGLVPPERRTLARYLAAAK
jgi:nitric oxide reductase subunit C